MSRIKREKERRKREMMLAAEKLFANKGFENVKMEEIARESEFTRKTLYSYFKDKDDLYRQVFLNISIQRWNYLVGKMKLAEDGIPRIRAFGMANYEYTIANPEHFKLIVHIDQKGVQPQAHDESFQAQINKARKEIQKLLINAYNYGRNNGSIRTDFDLQRNIVQLSISLRSMLNEVVLGYEKKEFYFDFLELFIKAIKTD
ncbi:MAG: TetR/AcrR family transcriptional regulator [Candidatus Cloacimonetes bacterium]|nr:TetR/AcrR family transcriptional regulator [Candidatus Cloacimonadota bacterium]MCF7813601.1 TetR/AcrR family transcriptional regulator [Candidatus Cloacimonadota bacterium]MCF7867917.1 TetR/AcrR family transcriptional regulator [Candidatus Cloacimonadota bacterium]MCF7882890.1 TetR/AcrR family transcriptional regulator [Candidatus Cloacimonadota bacterium]